MTYSSSRNCFLAAVALLLTVVPTVLSFAPAVARTFLSPSPPLLQMALEEVNPDDPFDNYQVSPAQTEVAIKDKVRGTGEEVKGEGQLLQIAYTGRFMADGKQFDKSDNFVCKIGKNQVLPGFEEGVMGMRVGGVRTIRIPPNKGYGDDWYKGTIPPSSHLEFDLELNNIAQTPQEEFQIQLEKFGVGRAIGMAVALGYLAVSPFLNI